MNTLGTQMCHQDLEQGKLLHSEEKYTLCENA